MSAHPTPIDKQEAETKKRRSAAIRSDALYISGALMVSAGLGLIGLHFGLIAAGGFCLLVPCLELATGFIRGLKAPLPRGR